MFVTNTTNYLIVIIVVISLLIPIILGIVALYDIHKRNLSGKKRAIFAIVMGCCYLFIPIGITISHFGGGGSRPSAGGEGRPLVNNERRVDAEVGGQNRAPAIPAQDPIRAMREVMSQIERIEISLAPVSRSLGSIDNERIRSLYRDLEYTIDVSQCPPDFQTAFGRYKVAFRNFMDSAVEVSDAMRELSDSFLLGGRAAAERRRDNASTAFFRARDRDLKAAKDDLTFILNRHTR